MPHGYKCDKCGEFVEAEMQECFGSHGAVEEVSLIGDRRGSASDEPNMHSWTLCGECRGEVVAFVEDDVGLTSDSP